MTNYKQKYEDLCRDIDLAIAGQKEGETKIVLQNIKERNREHNDESIIMAIKEAVNSYWSDDTLAITDILAWLEKQSEQTLLQINKTNAMAHSEKLRKVEQEVINPSLLGERDTTFNEEVTKYCRENNIYDTDKIGEVYSIATHFLYWQSHKPAEWSEEDEKNSSY